MRHTRSIFLLSRRLSSHSAAADSSYELRMRSVLVYGDSNTWGYDPESASSRSTNHRFPHHMRWTTICQTLLGAEYNLIAEGLNNRTTVFSDSISTEGEYDCNGRATLAVTLHTHKPLDLVVLAVGTNDLKSKFCATPRDITIGLRILVKDILSHTNLGHFVKPADSQNTNLVHVPPKLLIVGPPIVQLTALNRLWGFPNDVTDKAKRLSALMKVLGKELGIDYVDLGNRVSASSLDGLHYPITEQEKIAQIISEKIIYVLR